MGDETYPNGVTARLIGRQYPLLVALPNGRVRHAARWMNDGPRVTTLCRKVGIPTGTGDGMPFCAACANRPNPQDQRTYA